MCFSVLCISIVFAICLGVCIQLQIYYFLSNRKGNNKKNKKFQICEFVNL